MGVKILCTLGPASLSEKVIKRLTALDVSLFRLNLSHVKLEEVEELVQFIRGCSDTQFVWIRRVPRSELAL